jgi:hypothetical protein
MATLEQILAGLAPEARAIMEKAIRHSRLGEQYEAFATQPRNRALLEKWGELVQRETQRAAAERDPDFAALHGQEAPEWEVVQRTHPKLAQRVQALETYGQAILQQMQQLATNAHGATQLAIEMAEIARAKPPLSPKRIAALAIERQAKDWDEAVSAAQSEHEEARAKEQAAREQQRQAERALPRQIGLARQIERERGGGTETGLGSMLPTVWRKPSSREAQTGGNLAEARAHITSMAAAADRLSKNR